MSDSKLWCVLLLLAGEHALDNVKQALFEKPVPQYNKASFQLRDSMPQWLPSVSDDDQKKSLVADATRLWFIR